MVTWLTFTWFDVHLGARPVARIMLRQVSTDERSQSNTPHLPHAIAAD
jgi:hypothetical protein